MPPIREHDVAFADEGRDLEDEDMPPLIDNPTPMTYTFFAGMTPASFTSRNPELPDSTPPNLAPQLPQQEPHHISAIPAIPQHPSPNPIVIPPNPRLDPAPSSSTMVTLPPPAPARSSHAKKRDASYIPRPPNAFILFRSSFIRSQQVTGKVEGNHSNLSKIIGKYWKALPQSERDEWEAKAVIAQAEHRQRYPDWRFRPGANAMAKLKVQDDVAKLKVKDGGVPAKRRRVQSLQAKDPPDESSRGVEDKAEEIAGGSGIAKELNFSITGENTGSRGRDSFPKVQNVKGKGRARLKVKENRRMEKAKETADSRCAKIADLLVEGKTGAELEAAVEEWEGERRKKRSKGGQTTVDVTKIAGTSTDIGTGGGANARQDASEDVLDNSSAPGVTTPEPPRLRIIQPPVSSGTTSRDVTPHRSEPIIGRKIPPSSSPRGPEAVQIAITSDGPSSVSPPNTNPLSPPSHAHLSHTYTMSSPHTHEFGSDSPHLYHMGSPRDQHMLPPITYAAPSFHSPISYSPHTYVQHSPSGYPAHHSRASSTSRSPTHHDQPSPLLPLHTEINASRSRSPNIRSLRSPGRSDAAVDIPHRRADVFPTGKDMDSNSGVGGRGADILTASLTRGVPLTQLYKRSLSAPAPQHRLVQPPSILDPPRPGQVVQRGREEENMMIDEVPREHVPSSEEYSPNRQESGYQHHLYSRSRGHGGHARRDTISFPMNTSKPLPPSHSHDHDHDHKQDQRNQSPSFVSAPAPPILTWQEEEERRRFESAQEHGYWWTGAEDEEDDEEGGKPEDSALGMAVGVDGMGYDLAANDEFDLAYAEHYSVSESYTPQDEINVVKWTSAPGRHGLVAVIEDPYAHRKSRSRSTSKTPPPPVPAPISASPLPLSPSLIGDQEHAHGPHSELHLLHQSGVTLPPGHFYSTHHQRGPISPLPLPPSKFSTLAGWDGEPEPSSSLAGQGSWKTSRAWGMDIDSREDAKGRATKAQRERDVMPNLSTDPEYIRGLGMGTSTAGVDRGTGLLYDDEDYDDIAMDVGSPSNGP